MPYLLSTANVYKGRETFTREELEKAERFAFLEGKLEENAKYIEYTKKVAEDCRRQVELRQQIKTIEEKMAQTQLTATPPPSPVIAQAAPRLSFPAPPRVTNPPPPKPVYVYAMQNSRNGYIKIGRSVNPACREKTLQGEDPDIKLIAKRKCNKEMEVALHRRFKDFRVRGEWFKLPEDKKQELLYILRKRS